MGILIEGGIVVTLDKTNRVINPGAVYIEDNNVKEIGPLKELKQKYSDADVLDASNRVVMPSFINTHHHFYSTFARGLNIPGEAPKDFGEILENMWWKLDDALLAESIYYSSLIPLMESVRNGVTGVIDHHESQSYQLGSLDEIAKAVEEVGIKASLCLGISDRFGKGREGLDESRRFLEKISKSPSENINGMVGLHASFTVGEDSLNESVMIADEFNTGIHVHCAEDISDQEITRKKYGKSVVERFKDAGVLNSKSLLVHCIHIDNDEIKMIKESGASVVHNPESNMNNAVGYAKVLDLYSKGIDVGIGTDGMASSMLGQMRCAFFQTRNEHRDPTVGFMETPDMLLGNNPKILKKVAGWDMGTIQEGQSANIATIDYNPVTPLNGDNFLGHLLFGMSAPVVDSTICSGKLIMRHKKILTVDEVKIYEQARAAARKVWDRIL
ncbi:MAG: putative aminohydrolase SsnA [Elusimicrobiota bacterium]|nr:putative aminohydrolase SsnA [Elusimicrobiota bacterium]